jgi:ABC-type bacteriocin/lantibiotic exporter with double-glycine peptidase domain
MILRFPKGTKNRHGALQMDVIAWHNGKKHTVLCDYIDSKIFVFDISELYPNASDSQVAEFEELATKQYKEQLIKKQRSKEERQEFRTTSHWWNTLTPRDKHIICKRVQPIVISVVDAILEKKPDCIKRKHYESLIQRSQLQTMCVTSEVPAKKLLRFPRLTHDDKLVGSDYAFIALIEVLYPPMTRSNKARCA